MRTERGAARTWPEDEEEDEDAEEEDREAEVKGMAGCLRESTELGTKTHAYMK